MLEDLVELLDRQHAFMQRQDGVRFLLQLRRYFEVLEGDPRLRSLLEDLRQEAFEAVKRFMTHEVEIVERLRPLRAELERLAPGDPAHENDFLSFANWDGHASRDPEPPQPNTDNVSRSDILIEILERRFEDLNILEPNVNSLLRRIEAVAGDHRPVQHRLVQEAVTHAGYSAVRLHALVESLEDRLPAEDDDKARRMDWPTALMRQRFGTLATLAISATLTRRRGERALIDRPEPIVEAAVAAAKEELDLLNEELRRRIGTTRSRLALIHRFKQRCEWYDYEALRELAAAHTRRAEDLLTHELIRFLFGQGLNPIAKPLMGRLEPDVLDPSLTPSFYVEAKQYTRSCRTTILQGVWQAHETLSTLAGTRYDVREGYFVVFRRSGPRYSFPERAEGASWVLYPVLIDLGPDLGSRGGRQAEAFTVSDLEPRRLELKQRGSAGSCASTCKTPATGLAGRPIAYAPLSPRPGADLAMRKQACRRRRARTGTIAHWSRQVRYSRRGSFLASCLRLSPQPRLRTQSMRTLPRSRSARNGPSPRGTTWHVARTSDAPCDTQR